jgi:hypothetical protein
MYDFFNPLIKKRVMSMQKKLCSFEWEVKQRACNGKEGAHQMSNGEAQKRVTRHFTHFKSGANETTNKKT